ncbi:MAG: sugar transferase [Methanosarcina sp.]
MSFDQVIEALNPGRKRLGLRQHSSTVLSLHRVTDILSIAFSLFLAFIITGTTWSDHFIVNGMIAALLFFVFADMKNIYRSWRTGSMSAELWYTLEAWMAVFIVLYVNQFIWPDKAYPQEVMLVWLLMTPLCLTISRLGIRQTLRFARQHGFNTRNYAVAGTGEIEIARHIARIIDINPWMGFKGVGIFDCHTTDSSFNSLVKMARCGEVDTVFIAPPAPEAINQIEDLIERLSDSTASVYLIHDRRFGRFLRKKPVTDVADQFVADFMKRDILRRCWMEIGGIPAVSVYESPFLGASGWLKRTEDLVLGLIALVLLIVPMIVIGIGVKRSGRGPIFFKQRRYGLAGEQIMVWKFRTMTVCEDGETVVQARKFDSRVTPFGAFLRRTSLDELPQFINVLQGRMSVIGPRPHAVAHNEYYRHLVGGYMLRHKVKPGITGLAQVRGWRGETDTLDKMVKRVECDLEYIRNWSVWLDVKILLMTVINGFMHKNAY